MDNNQGDRLPGTLMPVIRPAAVLAMLSLILALLFYTVFLNNYEGWTKAGIASWVIFGAAFALPVATAALIGFDRQGVLTLIDIIGAPARRHPRAAVFGIAAASSLAAIAVACWVLDRFPNSNDEYAYILQAKTYASGRLWVDAPPLPEVFRMPRFLDKNGIWISQYTPGWPIALTPFAFFGVPLWLVNPLLAAGTVLGLFLLARDQMSPRAAWVALLMLACSTFFIFNYASYFSHGVAALSGVASVLFATRHLKRGQWPDAVLAGVCLGFLGLTRPFNALIFAIPIAISLVLTPGRKAGGLLIVLGGLPFLAALLFYNAAVTGSPFVMTAAWLHPGGEPLGAPNGKFMMETVRRLALLAFWSSPLLPAGWAAAFLILLKRGRLELADWIAPATLVAFIFYGGDSGPHYGPRYYFEAWPFIVLTVCKGLDVGLFQDARQKVASWAAAAVLVHFAFVLGYGIPRSLLEHQVVVEREGMYRVVDGMGLKNAVVLVGSDVGKIRPTVPSDLLQNGLVVGDEPVTYANDLPGYRGRLHAIFPNRAFFAYADGQLSEIPGGGEDASGTEKPR